MIVTVTSYKGGVGKTTTAIHLAAYLQRLAPTLLVDGDGIRSATKWANEEMDRVCRSKSPVPRRWQSTSAIISTL